MANEEKPIKTRRALKASKMSNISPDKYVPDDLLIDAPARLFRALINKLEMNPQKWGNYLRHYLDWSIPSAGKTPEKLKSERGTRVGNIKETFFQKDSMTHNKLMEGLSILRMRSCELIMRVKDEDGNIIEVSDIIGVMGPDRGPADDLKEDPDKS